MPPLSVSIQLPACLIRPEYLRRIVGAGLAVMVLLLTVCAASPTLHEEMHCAGESGSDDQCAVVLFTNGVSLPAEPITFAPTWSVQCASVVSTAEGLFLVSPRFLRQPERGPPVG